MRAKWEAFINEYLRDFNGAQAAIRAGYSPRSARQHAHRLLTNDDILNEIRARLDEMQMSADEALKLHADIARGDLGDFLDPDTLILDIRKAYKAGKTRLIKKLKQRTVTKLGKDESGEDVEIHDMEIELYPADVAQDRLLRVHGKIAPDNSNNLQIVYINDWRNPESELENE